MLDSILAIKNQIDFYTETSRQLFDCYKSAPSGSNERIELLSLYENSLNVIRGLEIAYTAAHDAYVSEAKNA